MPAINCSMKMRCLKVWYEEARKALLYDKAPSSYVARRLVTVQLCEAMHTLPGPGGLLDQDPEWVWWMKTVQIILAERNKLEADKAKHLRERKQ